jgi:drug/metabolite transporter (DMT)-like permease
MNRTTSYPFRKAGLGVVVAGVLLTLVSGFAQLAVFVGVVAVVVGAVMAAWSRLSLSAPPGRGGHVQMARRE